MSEAPPIRTAVITISTSKAAGSGVDESGPVLVDFAGAVGAEVVGTDCIPDDREVIERTLCHWCDEARCELVLTTGGTGFAPSDVTPEATAAVIERAAPGVAEAMRMASRAHTRHWFLSRGIAGIRGHSLVINFPGSPGSIAQAGAAIGAALPHAIELLSERPTSHTLNG